MTLDQINALGAEARRDGDDELANACENVAYDFGQRVRFASNRDRYLVTECLAGRIPD